MKRRIYSFFILTFVCTSLLSAQNKGLTVSQFVSCPQLQHASVGFCVKDFSGKTIHHYNEKTSRTPASTLKLVTTASALEILGADFQYKTTLAIDHNNPNHLLIRGSGDPTLGTAFLENDPQAFLSTWVNRIKQNIDTAQTIDITVIDDCFGYEGVSERWIRQDLGIYYASAAYGISIFDNTYQLYLNTTRRDTCPVIIRTEPEMDIDFTNTLTLNSSGEDNGYIRGEPMSNRRLLIGDIPFGKSNFRLQGDIPNPGLYLGQLLAMELAKCNIKVGKVDTSYDRYNKQRYSLQTQDYAENIFYTHYSPLLKDIVRDVNVRSNNHYAEHLIRTIGRFVDRDIYSSPLQAGIKEVLRLWSSRGIDTKGLFMYDGCGLAPSNGVSPEILCDLLLYMQGKSDNSESFLDSFAKAGVDGTVKSLLRGTRLAGKLYVKSGTIVNVRCYSGYYIDGSRKYAFAIMVNNYNSPLASVVKDIERLLLETLR